MEDCHGTDDGGHRQQAGLGGPLERATRRRRASSTRSSSAGTSRSTPIRSTAATRSPRSAARTRPASGRRWTPDAPTAWTLYIGTEDVEALAQEVTRRRRHRRDGRRSTSATRAGWPSSRIRPAPSSRPGRAPGWAASRPTLRTRSAGPSSTPAASRRRCRSTRAGLRLDDPRRATMGEGQPSTPSSCSTARASPAPGR